MYTELSEVEKNYVKVVLKEYALQDFDAISKNTVGFVNQTFIIQKNGCKYVLRESNIQKKLDHLNLEIQVLQYLRDQKFALTPVVFPNSAGANITFSRDRFYILQSFIPGESKANWNDLKNFNNEMLVSFFKAFANFTKAVQGFYTNLPEKDNSIFFYMTSAARVFKENYEKIPQSSGKTLLRKYYNELKESIETVHNEMSLAAYQDLPRQIVHFDFHPGNVNFLGNEVCGIFDLDWVRFDSRISDIASTIAQSCWYYGGENTGLYDRDKIILGLRAYREAYGKSEFSRSDEDELISLALRAYLIFQMLWSMNWYKDNIGSEGDVLLQTLINSLLRNNHKELISNI